MKAKRNRHAWMGYTIGSYRAIQEGASFDSQPKSGYKVGVLALGPDASNWGYELDVCCIHARARGLRNTGRGKGGWKGSAQRSPSPEGVKLGTISG